MSPIDEAAMRAHQVREAVAPTEVEFNTPNPPTWVAVAIVGGGCLFIAAMRYLALVWVGLVGAS